MAAMIGATRFFALVGVNRRASFRAETGERVARAVIERLFWIRPSGGRALLAFPPVVEGR